MVANGRTNYINAIGLPFLARHLVTLNFPERTMYLLRKLEPVAPRPGGASAPGGSPR